MKSFLVIGLGRFGSHLACKLAALGNEVMAVDENEAAVNAIKDMVTSANIADCMDEQVLLAFGPRNFDVCFVCIGENFQSSLEITSLLKDNGAKCVVSKAYSDIHARLLARVGADEVIYPERDMADRTALRFNASNALDYIQLAPNYSIIEILPPAAWIGHSIKEVDVRAKFNINIVAAKEGDGGVSPLPGVDYVFKEGVHLLIAGDTKTMTRFLNKHNK